MNHEANLRVSLTGPVSSAAFTFTHEDSTSTETVSLYDDGLHGDDTAGDGIYGGIWTPTEIGEYRFHVQGTTTNGGAFEQVISKVIKVQELNVLSNLCASANPAHESSVDFTVTFSEPVTGVDVSDLALTITGISGATVSKVSGHDNVYSVTVIVTVTGTDSSTLHLDVADDDTILDAANNPLGGAGASNGNFTSGETYDIIEHSTLVTKLEDTNDGLCDPDCSLREAIANAAKK